MFLNKCVGIIVYVKYDLFIASFTIHFNGHQFLRSNLNKNCIFVGMNSIYRLFSLTVNEFNNKLMLNPLIIAV